MYRRSERPEVGRFVDRSAASARGGALAGWVGGAPALAAGAVVLASRFLCPGARLRGQRFRILMQMRFAVLVFPGTWSDRDCQHVLEHELGQQADLVWHTESDLSAYDAVVIPGGFSYGDHLRCGAIARFSPVMREVVRLVEQGRPVIGICNGFQILCESHLLPGVLMRNDSLQFRCAPTYLRVEGARTMFTSCLSPDQVIQVPISHGEGNYYADPGTVDELEATGRIVFRYVNAEGEATAEANPNGSVHNIAGIVNEQGNVLGMMPHPERAAEAALGSTDGLLIFRSIVETALAISA
jgi:phosphoribosylformylglycinamidine synthase